MRRQRGLVRGLRALAALVLTASAVGRPLSAHAGMRHGAMSGAMPMVHGAHGMAAMATPVAPHPFSPGIQAAHACCPPCDGCWTCCSTPPTAATAAPVRAALPANREASASLWPSPALPGLTRHFLQPLSTGPPAPLSV